MRISREKSSEEDHNNCVGDAIIKSIAPQTFVQKAPGRSEAVGPQGNTIQHNMEAAEGRPDPPYLTSPLAKG